MKSCSEYSAGPGETQAIGVASADFDPSSAGDESALDQLYCNGSDVLDAGRLCFLESPLRRSRPDSGLLR
jgi:hypothetical protein